MISLQENEEYGIQTPPQRGGVFSSIACHPRGGGDLIKYVILNLIQLALSCPESDTVVANRGSSSFLVFFIHLYTIGTLPFSFGSGRFSY